MSTADIDYVVPPPDAEEEMLAKIVFGDSSDFQDSLANFSAEFLLNEHEDEIEGLADEGMGEETSGDESDGAGLEHVNDDQLFFMDDGEQEQGQDNDDDMMDVDEEDNESDSSDSDDDLSDAWEDSDDERLNVSVMTNNRTKKLRTTYGDNVLSGEQYVRRLRAQFERIYPRPQWADDEDDSSAEHSGSDSDAEDGSGSGREQVIDADIHALSRILQSTYAYKDASSSKLLPAKTLDILRLKDANFAHPAQSAIQSMSFHPSKPLLLTGGYDKTLRIYHIDGKHNHLVTSMHLKSTPIQTCTFYVTPAQARGAATNAAALQQHIFTGGRRRYMHSWDLTASITNPNANGSVAKVEKFSRMYGHEATQRSFEKFKMAHFYNMTTNEVHGVILLQGNNGWINMLHANTGIYLGGCKIEGLLVDFCIDYKPLSKNKFLTILIATNTYGEVWEFDLTNGGSILKRWKDESGVGITTIQVGGGTTSDNLGPTESHKRVAANRWLAIGCTSGFVNIYERRGNNDANTNPKPVAVLDQLTTTVSSLQFSPDGQILCMASRAVKDALRLVHLPTCTVFANWPTSGTPLGKVTSVAFSPRGEMLAVGNEQGKVRLWRLNHY